MMIGTLEKRSDRFFNVRISRLLLKGTILSFTIIFEFRESATRQRKYGIIACKAYGPNSSNIYYAFA